MSDPTDQIDTIEQVVADLQPGLTAREIATLIYEALNGAPPPAPAPPAPAPTPSVTLTGPQRAFLQRCADEGTIGVPNENTVAPGLVALGLIQAAAAGSDFTIWRLTPQGQDALS
jgi:hypothetical protein